MILREELSRILSRRGMDSHPISQDLDFAVVDNSYVLWLRLDNSERRRLIGSRLLNDGDTLNIARNVFATWHSRMGENSAESSSPKRRTEGSLAHAMRSSKDLVQGTERQSARGVYSPTVRHAQVRSVVVANHRGHPFADLESWVHALAGSNRASSAGPTREDARADPRSRKFRRCRLVPQPCPARARTRGRCDNSSLRRTCRPRSGTG